jgi:hypothetical protein
VSEPVSSLVWHLSVRAAVVPAGEEAAPGEFDPAPAEPSAGVPADDVPAAATPLVEPADPEAPRPELVAADTEPENEQADSARTASTAAGTGRAAREGKIVMDPR